MKNKDINNKIMSTLKDTSAMNPDILDLARKEMNANKMAKNKINSKIVLVCCCSLVLICLCITLPIILSLNNSGEYKILEYSSMREYFYKCNINIKTFNEIYNNDNTDIDSPNFGEDGAGSILYKNTDCKIIKCKDIDCFIEESYEHINGDKIKTYVILNNNQKLIEEFFADFIFDKDVTLNGINILYSFDSRLKIGKAKFNFNGFDLYLSFNGQSAYDIIYHIQKFINFQEI